MDEINLNDIRAFIKDVKEAFYTEEDMDDLMRYSLLKGVVSLRIKEMKLIKEI